METLKAQSLQAGIGTGLARQPSSDSVSSLSSACSLDKHEKKKKKGWVIGFFYSKNIKIFLWKRFYNTFWFTVAQFIYKSLLKKRQSH